jgi:hypothetical protein
MSVRPTQTKSRYPRRTRQPYPTDDVGQAGGEPSDQISEAGPAGPGVDPVGHAPAAEPEMGSRVVDRKAQRAARRTRRNVAIVCGLVVAVCLIITILIVNMARIRTSGPQAVVGLAAASIGPSRALSVSSVYPSQPILGAPASEGGNP